MRPLDGIPSLKIKLGVVIVASVVVTVAVVTAGLARELPILPLAIAATALALGMVQLLARGMTSPLREMASAARAMARGGYDRRVAATSRDEVGELARAFNKMSADLAETERIRRDLIANVSHDLRTPISALQAMLENLIDGVAPMDRATLDPMLDQVDRLGRLVEQLLDLSRLEAGTVELELRAVALRPLLEEIKQPFMLRGEDVDFQITVSPPDLMVSADRDRFEQVMANLLENCVRYSPPGGVVGVTAVSDGRVVRLTVEDEGPGLTPGEEEKIFERFYRSDASRSGMAGGAGLGLAIARWVIDLHRGSIRAENRSSKGTRFVVELGSVRG